MNASQKTKLSGIILKFDFYPERSQIFSLGFWPRLCFKVIDIRLVKTGSDTLKSGKKRFMGKKRKFLFN